MTALLVRLAGPLQSWGYRSRFSDRDTGLEPTKSGVIGLISCALGRHRAASPADLAALKMHVRVDRPGSLLTDFHTAGGGIFRGTRDYLAPTSSGAKTRYPVVTQRHYLQDASFLVALEGDKTLLAIVAKHLQDPHWPLALGRRSCPPSEPLFTSLADLDAGTALREQPLRLQRCYLPTLWDEAKGRYVEELVAQNLRLVLECGPTDGGAEMRHDVPVKWSSALEREYTVRFVREETLKMTPEVAH